jgi:hypothetical protein
MILSALLQMPFISWGPPAKERKAISMITDEFTLEEAREKRGQVVQLRPSVPWPTGIIGEIVDLGFSPIAAEHPPERVVFIIAWQLFPEYGAVPCTAMPLSKSQYQEHFQEMWLTADVRTHILPGHPS